LYGNPASGSKESEKIEDQGNTEGSTGIPRFTSLKIEEWILFETEKA
jgi:hypothetical protein